MANAVLAAVTVLAN